MSDETHYTLRFLIMWTGITIICCFGLKCITAVIESESETIKAKAKP